MQIELRISWSPNAQHIIQPAIQGHISNILFGTIDMMETDDDSKAGTLRRFWSRSLLVMMCVTSVSFNPCEIAVGPRVAYSVTTVKHAVKLVSHLKYQVIFTVALNLSKYIFPAFSHSRGKLYMKQACEAMIHSALVSQKIAMLHWGLWPRAARPLPKHFADS